MCVDVLGNISLPVPLNSIAFFLLCDHHHSLIFTERCVQQFLDFTDADSGMKATPILSKAVKYVWLKFYHWQFSQAQNIILPKFTNFSVRNYRSPTRHWRLTFRVGDHQLATWSPKKKKEKKKNEKSSSRESFVKKAGRSGASVLSFILPLPRLRFDRERNTDRETPTCHS